MSCASGLKRNLEHLDVRGSIILEYSTTTLPEVTNLPLSEFALISGVICVEKVC